MLLDRERVEFQSYLIEKLYTCFPGIVKSLKDCRHSVGESLKEQKHFHLEDSVWTHMLMVLQCAAQERINWKIKMLLAICHDFGKPFSRTISEKNGNSRFIGHGQMGVQVALDYLIEIQKDNLWLTDSYIKRIIQVVSGHIEFLNIDDPQKIYGFCNNDVRLFDLYCSLAEFDNIGRIISSEKIDSYFDAHEKLNNIVEQVNRYKFEDGVCHRDKNVYLICGPSNVGKDTYARNLKLPIVSLDDCRIEIFEEENPQHNLNTIGRYYKSFGYCKDKNALLMDRFRKKIFSSLEENRSIAICNTNCRRTSRRKIINIVKNHFRRQEIGFHCVFLTSESERILCNAAKNQEKEIPESVLWKFMGYQNLPNLNEGFDSVEIIIKK